MVGVILEMIVYDFGDLIHLYLKIFDRIDFGQYFEFRAVGEDFVNSIASAILS